MPPKKKHTEATEAFVKVREIMGKDLLQARRVVSLLPTAEDMKRFKDETGEELTEFFLRKQNEINEAIQLFRENGEKKRADALEKAKDIIDRLSFDMQLHILDEREIPDEMANKAERFMKLIEGNLTEAKLLKEEIRREEKLQEIEGEEKRAMAKEDVEAEKRKEMSEMERIMEKLISKEIEKAEDEPKRPELEPELITKEEMSEREEGDPKPEAPEGTGEVIEEEAPHGVSTPATEDSYSISQKPRPNPLSAVDPVTRFNQRRNAIASRMSFDARKNVVNNISRIGVRRLYPTKDAFEVS
jgi:hypothetical protein